jgi:quercetin dioxygenase-like cupin family protein
MKGGVDMISRRETIKTLAATLAVCIAGRAGSDSEATILEAGPSQAGSSPNPQTVALVFQHSLTLAGERDVTAATVEYAPGAGSPPHRHSGPVLGYVLEGAVVVQVDQGSPVTYSAGQMFFEPEGSIHQISRNASSTDRAKMLAIIFGKKGEQLTVPVK